ncbi:MAG: hypothetical protein HQM04_05515 [Magnetococcales bacterium]|nr:hypothetical protein [Magnetococcales bacterium]MBF0114484.1 hypothetical protein [Magnetococcales bacterium]
MPDTHLVAWITMRQKFEHDLRRYGWILCVLLSVLLSACGSGAAPSSIEAELTAGDTFLQHVQRYFFPKSYWHKKSEQMQERVRKYQESFNEQARAYHALLTKRRERVDQAITQAEAAGKSVEEARRLVIQEYRQTLDPVREETRQLGKELRRAMALLAQADMAARQ